MRPLRDFVPGALGVAAALVALALATCARAQDDPFGTPPAQQPPPPAPPATDEDASAPPRSSSAIVRAIERSQPTTPIELARAARTLLDIGRRDLAKKYLEQLAALSIDDQTWFNVHREIGVDFLVEISLHPELQPTGRTLADQAMTAIQRFMLDPARLDALAAQLADPSVHVRASALAELARLGPHGAAAILNQFADPAHRPAFSAYRQALQRISAPALEPLLAGAWADNSQLRVDSIYALGYLPTKASRMAVYAAAIDPGAPPALARVAARAIQRFDEQALSPDEISRRLREFATTRLASAEPTSADAWATYAAWVWDSSEQKVVELETQAIVAEAAFDARVARALLAASPDDLETRQLYLALAVRAAKIAGGIDAPMTDDVIADFGDFFHVPELTVALERAVNDGRIMAAMGLCNILAKKGDVSLLVTDSGRPSPVVAALRQGDPRLAYAAARMIGQWNPTTMFAGSSQYLDTLVRMATSAGYRRVLVGHADSGQAQTVAAILSEGGLDGWASTSSAEIFEMAATDGDVEFIVVSDTLVRPNYAELVRRLRADKRTRHLPITLLVTEAALPHAESLAPGDRMVTVLPWTTNQEYLNQYLVASGLNAWPGPIPPDVRADNARWALDQLEQFLSRDALLAGHDVGHIQQRLMANLGQGGLEAPTCAILGRLATPAAQTTLVNYASQPGVPLELRQAAADAFAAAVARTGILLTSTQIRTQYDRFNASAAEPADVQAVLSAILDAIETASSATVRR